VRIQGLSELAQSGSLADAGLATNGDGLAVAAGLPDGPECAIQQEDGTFKAVVYNKYTGHRLAHCCGASETWRAILRGLARRARALGIDGLYIDMISNVAGADLCFHPRHGHAPGGGVYQVEGFRPVLLVRLPGAGNQAEVGGHLLPGGAPGQKRQE
jgi:hypothetical protein